MKLSDELRTLRVEFAVDDFPGFGEPGASSLQRVAIRLVEYAEMAADELEAQAKRIAELEGGLDASAMFGYHKRDGEVRALQRAIVELGGPCMCCREACQDGCRCGE